MIRSFSSRSTGSRRRDDFHAFLTLTIFIAAAVQVHAVDRVFDVRRFGARGDGKSDDAAAIDRAIQEAVDAGGGRVWFPAAGEDYVVSRTLRLRGSGVEIHGFGATVRLRAGSRNGETVDLLSVEGKPDAPVRDVIVRGLTLDASYFEQKDSYRPRALRVTHAGGVLVDRVTIRRAWVGLTFGPGAVDCAARDCVVEDWDNDAFSASGDGRTGGCRDIRFVRCRAVGALDEEDGGRPGARNNAWEIEDGARGVRLLECVVDRAGGNAFAVRSHAGGSNTTEDVEFFRCQAWRVKGHGWYVGGSDGDVVVRDVRLVDCVSQRPIVTPDGARDIVVRGCWEASKNAAPLPPRLRWNHHTLKRPAPGLGADQAMVPLLSPWILDSGESVRDRAEWYGRRRPEIVAHWTRVLGKLSPAAADRKWFGDIRRSVERRVGERDGYTRKEIDLPIEKDFLQPHVLLLPAGQGKGPFPAVIAWTSTSPDYRQPEEWWGAWLARKGYVVLCGWSFIRNYRDGKNYASHVNEAVYERFGHWLPMGKMVHDVRREAEFLRSLPQVDGERLGFMGFSLSAKAALYVGAFAPEIKATVAIDPHIAMNGETNYHDPWYLDWRRRFDGIDTHDYPLPELRGTVQSLLDPDVKRPGFERNHHELLALCAPRAFLLIGCSMDRESGTPHSDNLQSWGYFNRAAEVYRLLGIEERLAFHAVGGGHRPVGPEIDPAWQRFFEKWLEEAPIDFAGYTGDHGPR